MLRAHKIELNPNNKQTTYFAKAAGVARFAYNWALAEWKRDYEAGEKPNEMALRRKLNGIKREQFPWMLEVTKNAPQMAIIQLGLAFKNFFKKTASYPCFRKKGIHDRFSLTNDQFQLDACRIRIPNLGWVRMREALRFEGKVLSATVSRRADKWFVSITVEVPEKQHAANVNENQVIVGVDVGISHFATLSTGEKITSPKPYRQVLNRIKRLSKSLSRKQKGSKNRRLSRAISDMGFYEFRRQLEYKTQAKNKQLIIANRWFPSSKRCSSCDYLLNTLSLSQRQWLCPQCNSEHDRDINAAKNLVKWAVSSTASACGASSGGIAA